MFKYVPLSLPASAPLVVALHGCTQRASDYGDETGWTDLARRLQFALLLPEQREENNPRRCFNWFNGWAFSDFWFWGEWGSDQDRGEGEALSIKQMIDRMQVDHGIDPARVFVTGLSGGGAMTAVMLAAYPELFAGAAILAGVPLRLPEWTTASRSTPVRAPSNAVARARTRSRSASARATTSPSSGAWRHKTPVSSRRRCNNAQRHGSAISVRTSA